jgi:hypothetical protein
MGTYIKNGIRKKTFNKSLYAENDSVSKEKLLDHLLSKKEIVKLSDGTGPDIICFNTDGTIKKYIEVERKKDKRWEETWPEKFPTVRFCYRRSEIKKTDAPTDIYMFNFNYQHLLVISQTKLIELGFHEHLSWNRETKGAEDFWAIDKKHVEFLF